MVKRVSQFFGVFLFFIGGCMMLPLIIALAYGENTVAGAFLISIGICLVPGIIIRLTNKESVLDAKPKLRESYFIVAISWILASLFGCLPYYLSGTIDNFILAFFETCSGFTTTGATVFADVEIVPHSILMWRSLTQWLGGMGMIVLFIALLPQLGAKGSRISSAETPGLTETRLTARYSDTAQRLYVSYIVLTAILFLLLLFGPMNAFDALNHAFTTMATGGFSTHNGGLSYFNSNYVYFVIAIFALLAGTNFALFFDCLAGKAKQVLKDEELRLYLLLITVATVMITISLRVSGLFDNTFAALSHSLFESINTISTLGFETRNIEWPSTSILVLIILMIIGGCSSSTAGGFKVSRLLIIFKMLKREVHLRVHGSMVEDVRINGKRLPFELFFQVFSYTILYVSIIILGSLLISLFGGGNINSNILTIISCISNLGPGLDNLGLPCDFNTISNLSVMVYCFVMIAGRLEVATLLVLFSKYFWKPHSA